MSVRTGREVDFQPYFTTSVSVVLRSPFGTIGASVPVFLKESFESTSVVDVFILKTRFKRVQRGNLRRREEEKRREKKGGR